MGMVIDFIPGAARYPDAVLEQAKGQYDAVMVLGYDYAGKLNVRATLNLNHAEILFLIETFKLKLLSGEYGGDD